ncbi:MAG: DNRLRE domain-containing protein [Archaeoglobaceae archaeon]
MNSKAVSPLIGFILLMAIVMGLIGILQSTAVPQWNKAVEAKHLSELKYGVADVSEVISLSASTGNPAKVVLKAGVDYPNYYVLVSPPKASTTISSKDLGIRVDGDVSVGGERREFRLENTTSAIIVEPNYFYSSRSKLIYEHSAVLRLEDSFVLKESDQISFSNNSISLYIIKANFNSFATTESANLIFIPVSIGGRNLFSGNISFECFDEKTAEWWNATLSKVYEGNSEVKISRTGNVVSLENLKNVTLSISVFEAYALATGEILPNPSQVQYNLIAITSTSFNVYLYSTLGLGARVVDNYGNPIRGVGVVINDPCNGDTQKISDERGEVWYYFNANCTGNQLVNFVADGSTVTFNINVEQPPSSGGGGGGTFTLRWYKNPGTSQISSYVWDVRNTTNQTNFYVNAIFQGGVVAFVPIYFVLNNTTIVSISDRSSQTNSTGWAYVNLTANMNGSVAIAAILGDSSAILNITVVNAGAVNLPPTIPNLVTDKKYYRSGETITATASGSTDPNGDPITYYYRFYDLTSNSLLRDWSTTNTYAITASEEGHRIRVYAKACDDSNACSQEVFTDVGVIKVIEIRDTTQIYDSYVRSTAANTNYGSSTLLYSGRTNPNHIWRTFIKFDLPPEITDARIMNATLFLYKSGHSGTPTAINLGAHRVLASWSETTINWNNQPSFETNPTNSITPPTTNNIYLAWNVTTDVQLFADGTANYGWCIKSSNENQATRITFNSKENSNTATRPYLRIEFAPKVD